MGSPGCRRLLCRRSPDSQKRKGVAYVRTQRSGRTDRTSGLLPPLDRHGIPVCSFSANHKIRGPPPLPAPERPGPDAHNPPPRSTPARSGGRGRPEQVREHRRVWATRNRSAGMRGGGRGPRADPRLDPTRGSLPAPRSPLPAPAPAVRPAPRTTRRTSHVTRTDGPGSDGGSRGAGSELSRASSLFFFSSFLCFSSSAAARRLTPVESPSS